MASIAQPQRGLADLVHALKEHNSSTQAEDEHPQSPPVGTVHIEKPSSPTRPQRNHQPSGSVDTYQTHKSSGSGYFRHPLPPAATPSARTGPPRSISYTYSISNSQNVPHMTSFEEESHQPIIRVPSPEQYEEDPDHTLDFAPATSPFRSALEYADAEQREREKEIADKRGKRRASTSYFGDAWNLRTWLETPRERQQSGDSAVRENEENGEAEVASDREAGPSSSRPKLTLTTPAIMRRSRSMPQMKEDKEGHKEVNRANSKETDKFDSPKVTTPWNKLRNLIPHIAGQGRGAAAQAGPSVVPPSVNITDELITGGLATLMLRLWFERDEKDHRRVPALFHRLRIRISDSLHPLHGHKAVFRIECEYANGAARWVVYRQLREFVSLHTHYALANAYNRNVETLPDFPKTSLPYFNWLKENRSDVGRTDFARMQREALENYLIGLIRSVMFHPAVNRLAGFLEISALSIALAQSGGAQYKAGFLRMMPSGGKALLGRKGTGGWKEQKKQRWCAVRESYLVILEEMGELTVHDVFLIDSDFKIERPKRYYRQGLNLLTLQDVSKHEHQHQQEKDKAEQQQTPRSSHDARSHVSSTLGSIKATLSKAFHLNHHNPDGHGLDSLSVGAGTRRRSDSASSQSSDDSRPQPSRPLTPMLDPSTNTNPLLGGDGGRETDDPEAEANRKKSTKDVSKHTFYVENSQMRLKLFAKNERQMLQWITALEKVARESHYTGKNRFDSFAPIRLNVAAQWLVDGRDYFWNLSRAILLARESIYIHDWWLSPELQMRRPNMGRYRLDHLLEKKAKDGVKIYIILYQEVSSRTTPTDSNYAKQRLTALHPNIMVQRSPSHFQTGTFYWAHHEKMCVIDQAIAFMGGLDLCFGRWDTPQHVLTDDPEVGVDGSPDYIWPGKDYSNPRILDFHTLNKPHEDMYDRAKVPRMPWHDVSMQVVGQPARDLARHFVQRWNYLLRIKNHTKLMPFLLPPPEFKASELTAMGLTGTCELQICRSAGAWSMGTPERTEFSIQNAYLKAIQLSEHFVYIENQFFITATTVNEVKIENKIGDAIVHRAIRAHREGTPWKCCILIPVLPGFSFPVDHSDASAIRIILECQNRTLFRGPHSIFARLRKEGMDPDDYISVFSLRNWAKLRGDVLTTEQVYIHAKVCIVDDRLAIIGSANINERSQRGDRDSEIAAVIRDTDMIDGSMAGKPFKVGRFAHTLRVRLMREHLGVDVDAMYEDDLMAFEPTKSADEQEAWDPDVEQQYGKEEGVTHTSRVHRRTATTALYHDTMDGIEQAIHGTGEAEAKDMAMLFNKMGVKKQTADMMAGEQGLTEERQTFTKSGEKVPGFTSSDVPTLEEKMIMRNMRRNEDHNGAEGDGSEPTQNGNGHAVPGQTPPTEARVDGELYGSPARADPNDTEPPKPGKNEADDEDWKGPAGRSTLRKHLTSKLTKGGSKWTIPTPTPNVDPNGFEDPICDEFWTETWVACAIHNTEIFRKVFHAIPDDMVTTWKQYKEFIIHHERLNKPVRDQTTPEPVVARVPSEAGDVGAPGQPTADTTDFPAEEQAPQNHEDVSSNGNNTCHGKDPQTKDFGNVDLEHSHSTSAQTQEGKARKGPKGPEPFDQTEREEMERLLEELRGHLVLYPSRFLEGEDIANNFLFNADRLMPLPIYD